MHGEAGDDVTSVQTIQYELTGRFNELGLDPNTFQPATLQWQDVKTDCEGRNQGRPTISTQAP
jgi:hypothetical protein